MTCTSESAFLSVTVVLFSRSLVSTRVKYISVTSNLFQRYVHFCSFFYRCCLKYFEVVKTNSYQTTIVAAAHSETNSEINVRLVQLVTRCFSYVDDLGVNLRQCKYDHHWQFTFHLKYIFKHNIFNLNRWLKCQEENTLTFRSGIYCKKKPRWLSSFYNM